MTNRKAEDLISQYLAMRITGKKVPTKFPLKKSAQEWLEEYVPYLRFCIGKKARELEPHKDDRYSFTDDDGVSYTMCFREFVDEVWNEQDSGYKSYLDQSGYRDIFKKTKVKLIDDNDAWVSADDAAKIIKNRKKLYDEIKKFETEKRPQYLKMLADKLNSKTEDKLSLIAGLLGVSCDHIVIFSPNEECASVIDLTDKNLLDDFFVDEGGTYISNSAVKIEIGWNNGVGLAGLYQTVRPSGSILTSFYEVA